MCHHLITLSTKKAVVFLCLHPQIFYLFFNSQSSIVSVEVRKQKCAHLILPANCSYSECWALFLYNQLQYNFTFTNCILALCLEVKWYTSKIRGFHNCENKLFSLSISNMIYHPIHLLSTWQWQHLMKNIKGVKFWAF